MTAGRWHFVFGERFRNGGGAGILLAFPPAAFHDTECVLQGRDDFFKTGLLVEHRRLRYQAGRHLLIFGSVRCLATAGTCCAFYLVHQNAVAIVIGRTHKTEVWVNRFLRPKKAVDVRHKTRRAFFAYVDII